MESRIMQDGNQNPFIGRGKPVAGRRLVGRDQMVRRFIEKVTAGANISVVGIPRIGKTSLARCAFSLSGTNQRFVAAISLDGCSSAADTFNRIGTELMVALDQPNVVSADRFVGNGHDSAYDEMRRFLRAEVCKSHYFSIIIDEFDAVVRESFQDGNLLISRLRELANDYDRFHLSFVFVSRRPLDTIQGRVDCSTLAGLCETIYLQPLSYDGIQAMVSRIDCFPTDSAKVCDLLLKLTGGHPYLSEVLLCEAFDQKAYMAPTEESGITSETVEKSLFVQAQEFTAQYRLLQEILAQDGLLAVLMQLVLGLRREAIDPHAMALLRNYGLVRIVDQRQYAAFSNHFGDYLRLMDRVTPMWERLGSAERDLRSLVSRVFAEKYGDDWTVVLINRNETIRKMFGTLEAQREKERKQFGGAASDNLLDYTYISDIRALIFSEWNECFSEVFSGGKADWQNIFEFVVRVRNPAAHFRDIPKSAISQAERALGDLQKVIDRHQSC